MKVEEFGQRVRELRRRHGLTQERLAERAGLSVDTVRRVERGAGVSLETMIKLADGFGVEIGEMLRADWRRLNGVADLLRSMSPHERELGHALIQALTTHLARQHGAVASDF